MEINRCYLSTPFSGEFPQVRQAIVEALRNTGVEPILVEDLSASPTGRLSDLLHTATCVIADVTGGNEFVLYEVGFAHAQQKPVLLITQSFDSAPAPLRNNFLLFVYDLRELARLQTAVTSWVRRYVKSQPEPDLS
jgi:hypothetical protein